MSESFLAKARMNGDGPRYLKLGRAVRYRESDLVAWLKMSAFGFSDVTITDMSDEIAALSFQGPTTCAVLKKMGLKEFEFKLRKEVGGIQEEVFLTGSGEVPDEYRKLVEEYYKNLAKRGGGGN